MQGTSLLDFLNAPFLVGDPDGYIVYANPAFKQFFAAYKVIRQFKRYQRTGAGSRPSATFP